MTANGKAKFPLGQIVATQVHWTCCVRAASPPPSSSTAMLKGTSANCAKRTEP